MSSLDKVRDNVAKKVRELRQARRWTQAELGKHLELSQNRLSEIEHGRGSFSAEQFLLLLRLFNVGVSHFVGESRDVPSELQNALARLGAAHLHEDADALPTEELEELHDVVGEAIAEGSTRLITSIAPVLARSADKIDVRRLRADLARLGLDRRLNWVLENVAEALREELGTTLPRAWSQRYRRALLVIESALSFVTAEGEERRPVDFLDPHVRSKQTLEEVLREASPISKKWRVATELTPADFAQALAAARVG